MHRCLLISEVVTHILEYSLRIPAASDNPHLAAQNPSAAAAMARTCHVLLEPSLDVVWRELRSLKPLLEVLPGDVLAAWTGSAPNHQDWEDTAEVSMITDPIAATDWARLDFYARRIRALTTWGDHAGANEYDGTGRLSDRLFLAITVFHPASRVVLPSLRKLTWEIREPKDMLKMNIFLGPNLRTLSLDIYAFDDKHYDAAEVTAVAAMAQLKYTCPLLEKVQLNNEGPITGKFAWHEEIQEVSQVICALPSVSHLSVGTYLSRRGFYHISKMHSLSQLFAVLDGTTLHPVLSELPFKPFPAMKYLELDGADISWLVQLLKAMDHCNIHNLNLVNSPKRDMKHINDLFRAMNKYCDHALLCNFQLLLSREEPQEDNIEEFTIDDIRASAYGNVFEPLGVFSHMTTIHFLFVSDPLIITDATLEFFAIHFPLLKEFSLHWLITSPNDIQTTVIGLASFKNSASLVHLVVPIGSVIVDKNNKAISATTGFHETLIWNIEINGIRALETQASYVGFGQDMSPMSVALFLRHIFPGITKINIPQVQYYIDNKGLDMEMTEDQAVL